MDCINSQKNINKLIRNELKKDELRETFNHISKCKKCMEVLLEEYSFYIAFNDQDKELYFDYENKLNLFLEKIHNEIKTENMKLTIKYTLFSIIFCVLSLIIFLCIVRIVF